RGALDDPQEGVSGDRETGQHRQQVERRVTVSRAEARHQAASNFIARTHLVWWTPGAPGTITRAGKPWSSERSSPFTFSASRLFAAATWPELSVTSRRAPPFCSDSTSTSAPPVTPAKAARWRRRPPVQRWVVDQPSTQAIGRS